MRAHIFARSIGSILAILSITTLLLGACVKVQPPPTPQTPGGNQPPVISSLRAAQPAVHPGGTTEIQCVASDPNGDNVNFKWQCTGGNFTGAGPTVIWNAPKNYGNYDITCTVEDGKGGSTQATLKMSVSANNPPVITKLSADPSQMLVGNSTTITCVASDPDGDILTYNWQTSEGTISGVGNKVTWVAPNKGGDFDVTVLITDGKGNETKGVIRLTVAAGLRTVTLKPVQQESGTVDNRGDKDTSRFRAGDDEKNITYCAYWSFDIWSLVGKEIQEAKLTLVTRQIANEPFSMTTGLGALLVGKVNYGDRLPRFGIPPEKLDRLSAGVLTPPNVIDVTPDLAHSVAGAATRFQIEAIFYNKLSGNGNGVAEWIEWSDATLTVTYSEK